MLKKYLLIFLISMVPVVELRGAIPYSQVMGLPLLPSYIVCIIGNMLLSDDQAQMATMGPIIKDIVDENVEGSEEDMYDLRCRNAMYGDAIGVLTGELIPWHVCNVYYVGLCAAVYPLASFTAVDLITLNFFAWISIGSLLILTLTGLDRFIPNFAIPREPQVQLKKNLASTEKALKADENATV